MAARMRPWTADEQALIARERARWLAVGRSTARADVAALQAAWAALYRREGHAPVFVWVTDGPLAAHAAMAVWSKSSLQASLQASLDASLGASPQASLGASLWASLDASLEASLEASLQVSLGDSLGDSLGASLQASLQASLEASLQASLWASLGDSLDASLQASLQASLEASLQASLWASLKASGSLAYRSTWFWGAHDAYWVGWYRTAEALGVAFSAEQRSRLAEYEQTVLHGLWAWPHAHGVVVCDRPTICRMEDPTGTDRWRLHAEDGPALAWRDGYQIHAWHGVRVPAWVIEQPERLTAETIAAEPNQEVRRAMIERIGWPRYLALAQARPVQSDAYGVLYRLRVDDVDVSCVVVTNRTPEPDGAYKQYGLLVPASCQTAHAAVASTFGRTVETYAPVAES